jgi:hypothetical protein
LCNTLHGPSYFQQKQSQPIYRSLYFSFNDALPKRYVTEFVRGVDKNNDDFLEKDDFSSFLAVIGASDKITPDELDQAMIEIIGTESMPNNSFHVPCEKMRAMMLDGIQRGDM